MVRLKDREYSELSSKKNSILVNHGKLQQEAEVRKYSLYPASYSMYTAHLLCTIGARLSDKNNFQSSYFLMTRRGTSQMWNKETQWSWSNQKPFNSGVSYENSFSIDWDWMNMRFTNANIRKYFYLRIWLTAILIWKSDAVQGSHKGHVPENDTRWQRL